MQTQPLREKLNSEHSFHLSEHNPDPVAAIITAIAELEQVSPLDLDPITLDLMDALTAWPLDGTGLNEMRLTIHGYQITVRDDGSATIKE